MKYQQQIDKTDCGPACIVMIASHYMSYISIGRVRELCKTDYIGTNLAGMVRAAESLGFSAKPVRGTVQDATLNAKLSFPFIAHVRVSPSNSTSLNHYVVVKKITKHKVLIWDPDPARKKTIMSRSNFLKWWTGYTLFLSPSTEFVLERGNRNALFKFFPLLSQHKKNFIIICLASALLIVFGIVISFYYKYIIDEVVISRAGFTLLTFSIGALLITLNQSVVETMRSILINHIAYKTGMQISFSYITHILKLPLLFFDSRKTGEILSRLMDVSIIQRILSGIVLSLILDCILVIIIGPILFKINGLLFAIALANVTVMSIVIFFFSRGFRTYYGRLRREEADVNSSLVEAISGVYTVKALNAGKVIGDIYEKQQMKATWTGWKTTRLSVAQQYFAGLINGITTILIFWVGISGIIQDTFSLGTLMSFTTLLAYFTGPLYRLINLQPQLQEASIAAERVAEILEIEPEQVGEQKLLKIEKVEGDIIFEKVAFKYGMRPLVYHNLSFQIRKGQRIAFVGQSGCGKTTLVKLLLKF
jgi:ATP-binding cassette subfamily B protein